jgi:hypothetical protein
MKKIYKYELEIKDCQTIILPFDYEILSVQSQNNKLVLWAMVYPDNSLQQVTFNIVGTGNPIATDTQNWLYLASVQMFNGLVWHVFETL